MTYKVDVHIQTFPQHYWTRVPFLPWLQNVNTKVTHKKTNKNKTRVPELTRICARRAPTQLELTSFSDDEVFKSEHHFHFVTGLKQGGLPLIPNFLSPELKYFGDFRKDTGHLTFLSVES